MLGPVGSVEQTGRRCPALGQQVVWTPDDLFLQVVEDLVDHCRLLDAGNHFDGATAGFDIDLEHTSSPKQTLKNLCIESPERLRPAKGLKALECLFEYSRDVQHFLLSVSFREKQTFPSTRVSG